jgi:zinc transport system permease protein
MNIELFQYAFMVRAFEAGIIVAIIAPVVGNFLVVRRYSLIADTLSHVALAGVALGVLLKTQPLPAAVVVTVGVSWIIELLRTRSKTAPDTILAMILPGGLALSVLLMALGKGSSGQLFTYLFGSITTVQDSEVMAIAVLGVIVVGVILFFYRQLLYVSFDEDSARINGIRVPFINFLFITITALTVSVAMRIVGALLIGALMIIPSSTAMQVARGFWQGIGISIAVALFDVIAGLTLSYYLNVPSGATIVLTSLFVYFCTRLAAVGRK